jgi:hypothetical protein
LPLYLYFQVKQVDLDLVCKLPKEDWRGLRAEFKEKAIKENKIDDSDFKLKLIKNFYECLYVLHEKTPINFLKELESQEIINFIKQYSIKSVERILNERSKNITVDAMKYSIKRSMPPPPSVLPSILLEALTTPASNEALEESCIEDFVQSLYRHGKRWGLPAQTIISNKATLEFPRQTGGFNYGFSVFRGLLGGEIPNNPIEMLIYNKASQERLEEYLLKAIPVDNIPFVYYIDIPERGAKHRLPGIPEFFYSFLAHRIGSRLKGVMPLIVPKTFRKRLYALQENEGDIWYNSTDAVSSTDNPSFELWRTLLLTLMNQSSVFDMKVWPKIVNQLIGPHYFIEDSMAIKKYQKEFTKHDPLKIKFMGEEFKYEPTQRFYEATKIHMKPQLGIKTCSSLTIAPKRTFDWWLRKRADLIPSVGFLTRRGTLMSYGFTSILLAFLTNLPMWLNPEKPIDWITTGDDAVSSWHMAEDIEKHRKYEEKINYVVNYQKTIVSQKGYVIAEEIFIKNPMDQLQQIVFPKFKRLWRDNPTNSWIYLPKILSEIDYLEEHIQERFFILIWNRHKDIYEFLAKNDVPLHTPLGIFPRKFVGGSRYQIGNLEESRFKELHGLFKPEGPDYPELTNDEKESLEIFNLKKTPFTYHVKSAKGKKPEQMTKQKFWGICYPLVHSQIIWPWTTSTESALSPKTVLYRWNKLKGGKFIHLPEPEKDTIITDIYEVMRGKLSNFDMSTLLKSEMEELLWIDYNMEYNMTRKFKTATTDDQITARLVQFRKKNLLLLHTYAPLLNQRIEVDGNYAITMFVTASEHYKIFKSTVIDDRGYKRIAPITKQALYIKFESKKVEKEKKTFYNIGHNYEYTYS